MPKPTLKQRLLGRPSQKYSPPQPPRKDYYSSKHELIRIATTDPDFEEDSFEGVSCSTPRASSTVHARHTLPARGTPQRASSSAVRLDNGLVLRNKRSLIRQIASSQDSLQKPPNHHAADEVSYISSTASRPCLSDRRPVDLTGYVGAGEPGDTGDDQDDVFYTPASSLVPPLGSSSSSAEMLDSQALISALVHTKSAAAPAVDSTHASRMPLDHSLLSAILPLPPSLPARPSVDSTRPSVDSIESTSGVSRTASDASIYTSVSSSSSSASSEHDDEGSVFSSSCATDSTRVTTPAASEGSERGLSKSETSKPDDDIVEVITIVPTTVRRPRPLSIDLSSVAPATLPSSDSDKTVRRQSLPAARGSYTDEDWAREVRSFAPPPAPASPKTESPRRRARPLHPDLLPPIPPHAGGSTVSSQLAEVLPVPRPRPSRPKADRNSRHSHRQSRSRMSALWEEDESEYSGVSSAEPSRSSTPVPFGDSFRSGTPPPTFSSSTPMLSGSGPMHPRLRTLSSPMEKTGLSYLASMDLQAQSKSQPQTPYESPDSRLQDYARRVQRPISLSSSPSGSGFASGAASPLGFSQSTSALTSSLPTHALPTPFPSEGPSLPSGYTSLSLPHAAYTNKKGKPLPDGRVDLVRAGLAQSSMTTIEVVRGTASAGTGSGTLGRTKTRLALSLNLKKKDRRKKDSATPAHLRSALPLPVAFTAHLAPPSFVPSSHVLVQVFAVGLEGLDSLIVQEKVDGWKGGSKSKGTSMRRRKGFIPGRSFVGRTVECGFEVSKEVCRRGDWVIGLLDVRKSGALAEFILVERHRIYRSPQPRSRPISLFPPRRRAGTRALSLPPSSLASSPLAPKQPLSLEELALLPLCGIPAHRAVRTFADVLASRRSREAEGRPHALILMGHDGAGAMAAQMLGKRKVRVSVQIPESAVQDIMSAEGEVDPSEVGYKRERVEGRLRAWGVEEICVGEPLSVLERLVDEGRSFDAVLDTVGGACIWEAAQKLLVLSPSSMASRSSPTLSALSSSEDAAHSGSDSGHEPKPEDRPSHAQFTTLVGDYPERGVPKAGDNIRSGLRSMRRAMSTSSGSTKAPSSSRLTKKEKVLKRTVGYSWINVSADVDFDGGDVRDALSAVLEMSGGGSIRPWTGCEEDEDKVVTFENAPEVFRRDSSGPRGVLGEGGTCVVKIGA
ncbi:hypothetical protein AcW2_006825 [Taiwanofungus camphoratus]|nr:hypothetical protein AcW2_006825 [Antrodia cinnamomea]